MKGLISTEHFQKIVISYEVLSFSRFWRNERNSFYHLCGLTVSQKSQNYTRKSQLQHGIQYNPVNSLSGFLQQKFVLNR